MEQKKTLWIIVAVGAFLLVVLFPAMIIYKPAAISYQATHSSIASAEKNLPGNGWTNSSAQAQTISPWAQDSIPQPPNYSDNESGLTVYADNVYAENATVYSDFTTTAPASGTTIDLNSLKNPVAETAAPQNINITVNVSDDGKTHSTVIEAPKYSEPKTDLPRIAEAPKPAPAVNTVKPAAKAPAKPSAPVVQETKKTVTQYWVQVAAYSNKKTAENARSVLDANKITSDIFTYKDNKDKMFFRVRVGPYTTKSEAEYWRTRIIKIDEFSKAESYVTSTTN